MLTTNAETGIIGNMRRLPRAAAAVVLAAMALGLTACVTAPQSASCVDWVLFDSPEDAAADAGAVVIARVDSQDSTATMYGAKVNVWKLEVSTWLKGEGDDTILVASSPRTCEAGSPYPDGDPLDTDDEVVVFLAKSQGDPAPISGYTGEWTTITGYQGVIPATAEGGMPAEWPPNI